MPEQTPFRVLGLDIEFPFQPYNIQKAMMNKMVATLTNKEHSLIESPTGTGKTLVLLCSALAWRKRSVELGRPFVSAKYSKKMIEERIVGLKKKPCHCGRRQSEYISEIPEKDDKCSKKKLDNCDEYEIVDSKEDDDLDCDRKRKKMKKSEAWAKYELITLDDSDNENISSKPLSKNAQNGDANLVDCIPLIDLHPIKVEDKSKQHEDSDSGLGSNVPLTSKNQVEEKNEKSTECCKACRAIEAETIFLEMMNEGRNVDELFIDSNMNRSLTRIPKIYYGTRTHKQITQVIRELNKTIYCRNLQTSILSSRDRTCVNEQVRDMPSRNDKCKELMSNHKQKNPTSETCSYYSLLKASEKIFLELNEEFKENVWDIEDGAAFGKKVGCCPYFGLRELMTDASIIFCPYNYLIDPSIRKVMDINLKNSVIIFDEAHNIEDICRDSASFTVSTKQILDISAKINKTLTHLLPGKTYEALKFFQNFFNTIASWMISLNFEESKTSYDSKFDEVPKYFKNKEDILKLLGMTEKDLSESLTPMKNDIVGSDEEENEKEKKRNDNEEPTILEGNQAQLITQLINTLTFIYTSKGKFFTDFELVVTRQIELKPARNFGNSSRNNKDDAYVWQFNLLCMNSAVSFEKIKSDAWSVIVASGTLSPIESLRTELGVSFEYTFEGVHTIARDRFFASIITRGPKNLDLDCSWKNTNTLAVQDELGCIVRDVCKVVPNGVLCFFPSYDRMDAFYKRWTFMKIMSDIKKHGKTIHRETKDLSAENFEFELSKYRENAKSTGAILMAVFRGKVSEGIDFSDQDARAVITIGIPYPNFKNVAVNLKKDYNDLRNRHGSASLLSGRDWYSAQGFRALNQALGRCIRHKDDWGAIIMLDSRLVRNNAKESISKWIRQNMQISRNYNDTYDALTEFVRLRTS